MRVQHIVNAKFNMPNNIVDLVLYYIYRPGEKEKGISRPKPNLLFRGYSPLHPPLSRRLTQRPPRLTREPVLGALDVTDFCVLRAVFEEADPVRQAVVDALKRVSELLLLQRGKFLGAPVRVGRRVI